MKKVIGAAVLLASLTTASAVQVHFQVNMEIQTALGNFNPGTDTAEVRGSFDGWGAGFVLSQSATEPNVYEGATDISGTAGDTIEFKFVINSPGSDLVWESINNRSFTLEASEQTLPIVYFNNLSVDPGEGIAVTFRVNMEIQTSLGRFNPDTDTVEVRGSFNGWTAGELVLSSSAGDVNIYEGATAIQDAPGTTEQFKFVIVSQEQGDIWEGDVGEGMQNRAFTLEAGTQELETVYFDNLSVDPGAGIPVTFQVNMELQLTIGKYDPATEVVEVRGPFNNWGPGDVLTPSADNENLYQGEVPIQQAPGANIQYKFVIYNEALGDGATVWENDPNRSFVLADAAQSLPEVYFNNQVPGESLTEDTVVTFIVDMNGATTFPDGTAFDPGSSMVFINGDFFPWWDWDTEPPFDSEAFDDGQVEFGDQVEGDGIYSVQYTFPAGSPVRVEYKYSIDGADNESAEGDNRVRYIPLDAGGAYTMPMDVFGQIVQEANPAITEPPALAIGVTSENEVTITWAGGAGIYLQSTSSFSNPDWQDVPNTDGQSSLTVTVDPGTTMFFRGARGTQ